MPRIARGETVGGIYHIINIGNLKMQVVDDAKDYGFKIGRVAKGNYPLRLSQNRA